MSQSLNSLKRGYIGDYIRNYYGGYQGDARSVDCSPDNQVQGLGFCAQDGLILQLQL